MQRRDFIIKAAASLAATELAVICGCTTTASVTATPPETHTAKNRLREIDTAANAALARLYPTVQGSRELVGRAEGVLVFPSVIAAGLGVGGQYGEGVLREGGKSVDYYSLASLSVGLQIGAQSKSIFILFMTQDALNKFRNNKGWAIGVDASVAVLKVGANGNVEMLPTSGPVVALVLTNAGLMANLTLEGTKITPLKI